MCDQQRLRPACAYAQSDQNLCWSFEYSMTVKLLTEQHLEFLNLTGGCTGWSESTLVKMPHCWKSHDAAHNYVLTGACVFIRLTTVIITRLIRHGCIICLRIYTPRYKKRDWMVTSSQSCTKWMPKLKIENF